ncbi:hypothetical protein E2542_SST16719 [Spatholobus suberectus]|nr:hypothetical protein E2542_SST16719 [Spatholobus suberectus]
MGRKSHDKGLQDLSHFSGTGSIHSFNNCEGEQNLRSTKIHSSRKIVRSFNNLSGSQTIGPRVEINCVDKNSDEGRGIYGEHNNVSDGDRSAVTNPNDSSFRSQLIAVIATVFPWMNVKENPDSHSGIDRSFNNEGGVQNISCITVKVKEGRMRKQVEKSNISMPGGSNDEHRKTSKSTQHDNHSLNTAATNNPSGTANLVPVHVYSFNNCGNGPQRFSGTTIESVTQKCFNNCSSKSQTITKTEIYCGGISSECNANDNYINVESFKVENGSQKFDNTNIYGQHMG